MVEGQIARRGVRDPRVLSALTRVPRHRFVPPELQDQAYDDGALPIGDHQTISQPYIVAVMSEMLELRGEERVLEIGTGSGYQTAILAELAGEVFSVEILPALSLRAQGLLGELGYANIRYRVADGYRGWVENGPYDGILAAAAPTHVPEALLEQLKPGGRLVLPVGDADQDLLKVVREGREYRRERSIAVRFVPMTGEAQRRDRQG
jgi:protein-L-isoaspartate(D-aspartate) O-methyltransferase